MGPAKELPALTRRRVTDALVQSCGGWQLLCYRAWRKRDAARESQLARRAASLANRPHRLHQRGRARQDGEAVV